VRRKGLISSYFEPSHFESMRSIEHDASLAGGGRLTQRLHCDASN